MSTYLTLPVSDSSELIVVKTPIANPSYPLFYDLGSETIKVVAGADTVRWEVERAIGDTQAAPHGAGTALIANASPYGGGGPGTPAAFVEPTTATPEAIVDALIAAGLMDAS